MIVCSGDWHGDFKAVIREIKALDLRDCTIFQVGDFGIGFNSREKELRTLDYLTSTLKSRNIMLYAIRGNHDDPAYFNGSISTSNIKLLPDYSVVNVDQKNVLCVGGAISIDRKPNSDVRDARGKQWHGRKEGVNYWEAEAFNLKEDIANAAKNIDVVITHSCPDFCEPRSKHGLSTWIKSDPSLIELCAKERNEHSKLYDILKFNGSEIKYWTYGHFHDDNVETFHDTKFVMIGIYNFYELRF